MKITAIFTILIFIISCTTKRVDNNSMNISQNKIDTIKSLKKNDSVYKLKCNYNILYDSLLFYTKTKDKEITTGCGYVRIGNFLNKNKKNALIVEFTQHEIDTCNLYIFELDKNKWKQIYFQKNIGHNLFYPIKARFNDYNFDGKTDIALLRCISNGAALETIQLWLQDTENKTFRFVENFEKIGIPLIEAETKTIKGLWACCVFQTIRISEYKWTGFKLHLKHTFRMEDANMDDTGYNDFYEIIGSKDSLIKSVKMIVSKQDRIKMDTEIKRFYQHYDKSE